MIEVMDDDIETSPLASIIIPVFNGENYLREAIDSAVAQTYKNVEIIVVDDGSVDATAEIARSYGSKIRYFYQNNGGQSAALNTGIREMHGSFFNWLSHDDVFCATKIEQQMEMLRQYNYDKKYFVYSDYELIDSTGTHISWITHKEMNEKNFVFGLLDGGSINGCTVMIHKQSLMEQGLFNTERPHTSDIELFVKLGLNNIPIRVEQPLVKSRAHQQQASITRRKYHEYELGLFGRSILSIVDKEKLRILGEACGISKPYQRLARSWSNMGIWRASSSAIAKSMQHELHWSSSFLLYIECGLRYLYRKSRREISRWVKIPMTKIKTYNLRQD